MNSKIVIFLLIIISSISLASNNILLGGLYTIKLHVLDPDERYPVTIELFVLDNAKIKYANFKYPTYNCSSTSKRVEQSKEELIIHEKMIIGKDKCEETSYIFNFKHGSLYSEDGSKIVAINNSYDNKIIPSVIKTLSYKPTLLSEFRIKYKVGEWEDISKASDIQMLKDYLSLGDKAKNRDLAIELIFKLMKNNRDELKRLVHEYPGTKSAIKAEQKIYQKVKLENSWNAYVAFMMEFPKSKVISSLEIQDSLFKLTKTINNQETYYRFLNRYPLLSGYKLKEVEAALFEIAKVKGNMEDIHLFIEKHADSEYVKSAMYELFKDASKKNNWESYTEIIDKYPESIYSEQALRNIYGLLVIEEKIELYLKFLKQFPNSELQGQAYNSFLRLVEKETFQSKYYYYNEYLKFFPNDKNISTYLAILDEIKQKEINIKLENQRKEEKLIEKKRLKKIRLDNEKLEKEKKLYAKRLKLSGVSLVTKVKKIKKGERYIPSVSNTYYTTEDQSYTINGTYINKLKSNKEYSTNGGYYIDVKGFDLLFAIDNKSEHPYLVTLDIKWNNTEYYYAKENYCMEKGWFFCSQKGKRYTEKEKNAIKNFKKNYIIGPNDRIKDKVFIGEKKPNAEDISYEISKFEPIDKEVFKKILFINSKKGLEEFQISKNYIIELQKNSLLVDHYDSFSKRMKEIETYHRDKFNEKHISLTSVNVKFGGRFDSDFDNVIEVIISAKLPLLIDLSIPGGVRNKLSVVKKEKSILGVCIGCDYSLTLSLKGLSGLSKKEIKDQIKIKYVYSHDDI